MVFILEWCARSTLKFTLKKPTLPPTNGHMDWMGGVHTWRWHKGVTKDRSSQHGRVWLTTCGLHQPPCCLSRWIQRQVTGGHAQTQLLAHYTSSAAVRNATATAARLLVGAELQPPVPKASPSICEGPAAVRWSRLLWPPLPQRRFGQVAASRRGTLLLPEGHSCPAAVTQRPSPFP